MITTRFAPSPTGLLHLGHAYSALVAWRVAEASGGRFLLRLEDIDTTRCREEFAEAIFEDLAWLGLRWPEPVRRQSEHLGDYGDTVGHLESLGVLYACFCTRKDIAAAESAPHGPEGPVYPGTCRRLGREVRDARVEAGDAYALRLDVGRAWDLVGGDLVWEDRVAGEVRARPGELGDVVLARKDIGTSYHLSVTVDDAIQGVNLVVRSEDLFASTHIHRLLQELLGLPVPGYFHHEIIRDKAGRRLAKRDDAQTLRALREGGMTAAEVRARLGV